MLSDLTVERKGFVPAPSRPRSTSIADFVANPKLDGVNYLSFVVNEGGKRLSDNVTGSLDLETTLLFMDEMIHLTIWPKTLEQGE